MAAVTANGIRIEYEEAGKQSDPVIMLIRGLGTQLIDWPVAFIRGLAEKDYRVIFHDNRDVGLSAKFNDAGMPDFVDAMARASAGKKTGVAYSLEDMALDVIGLQDALGIESAHIVGISMGGMIAQILAGKHSERVQSLVSVMSSSGRPDLPAAAPEVIKALTAVPDDPNDREKIISLGTETLGIIGSPGFSESEEVRRKIYTARYERCYSPAGVARQMLAIMRAGSRVDLLKTISVSTLVIHGLDDPLVPVAAGKDTAANIPGASLEIIEGMGHNLPAALIPRLVDLIARHVKSVDKKET
ncbi:MAG: alpha/beta fold hydrolase [Deltaproteobacteria bacterium]|nr:alpha/beta fold hydrolase [Deltaproteobacteria bacterium]